MATKPIITIDVDDAKFREFLDRFEAYQRELKDQPGLWGEANKGIAAGGAGIDAMVALIGAQTDMLRKAIEEQRRLEHATLRGADAMHRMAGGARETASHITSITKSVLKWGALIGGGLIGGSLFGIDRLAHSASTLRTRGLGLGVSPAALQALGINFGQLFNPSGPLGAIANIQAQIGGQATFTALGLPQAFGERPTAAFLDIIRQIHALRLGTPAGSRAHVVEYGAAQRLGFTPEAMRAISNLSDRELQQRIAAARP